MINYENDLWPLIYDQYNHGRHEKELSFYSEEFKKRSGKVLEIACGTGMIFLDMLKEGLDIYGFDISNAMLDSLSEKARDMGLNDIDKRISAQNMVDFSYEIKFDDIFIPARSFLHLSTQHEQIKCLSNIYKQLNNGGRLLLNFFNPNLSVLLKYSTTSEEYSFFNTYNHPKNDGETIDVFFNQTNNIPEQLQNISWKFRLSDKEYLTKMVVRWIYKEEFKLLLKVAGFKKWQLFGDFDKSEYTCGSKEMIWVIEK